MATQSYTNIAPDVTSFTTFLKWASMSGISLAKFGWSQGGDTGQVVWPATRMAITAASISGSTVTYTFTTPVTFGNAPAAGAQIVITGMTNGGNNGTFRILNVVTSTTFTVTNASGVTESGSTGTGNINVSVSITNATGNGTTVTYTYTGNSALFQAPNFLHAGMSIVITGCTTAGFNGTFAILTTPASNTFTVTNSTNATEAETTAFGDVTAASASPAANSTVYETWKMADTLQATSPVVMKLEYGLTAATSAPSAFFTIGTSSDGAGTINSTGSTGRQNIITNTAGINSTNVQNSDFSGSTNRFQGAWFHTQTTTNTVFGLLSVERSHDQNGNDTGDYFTYVSHTSQGSGGASQNGNPRQASVPKTGAATAQEAFWGAIVPNAATTGSFGSSTLVSPVFPMVGALGNPLLGVIVGRTGDFADQTVVPYTLYGTSHSYMILNSNTAWRTVLPASNGAAFSPPSAQNQLYCVGMRFE